MNYVCKGDTGVGVGREETTSPESGGSETWVCEGPGTSPVPKKGALESLRSERIGTPLSHRYNLLWGPLGKSPTFVRVPGPVLRTSGPQRWTVIFTGLFRAHPGQTNYSPTRTSTNTPVTEGITVLHRASRSAHERGRDVGVLFNLIH